MKFTVLGFQQQKLIDNKLNVEDAFILRTIKDMYSSASMEFKDFDGIKYMWINYSYLLEQIPIVGSKRNLMRRIEFYGKECLLLRILQKERNGVKGNYSYIAPTEKLDIMQDFDLMTESHKVVTKSHKPYDKTDINLMTESHNKDTSIKDTSIKDIYTKEVYDHWLLKAKHINNAKYTDSLAKEINKAIKKYGKDNILQAIDNYVEVFDSDYYYSATFTLINFLKQNNCIPRFVEGVDEKHNGDMYKGYKIKFPSIANMDKPYWSGIDS